MENITLINIHAIYCIKYIGQDKDLHVIMYTITASDSESFL